MSLASTPSPPSGILAAMSLRRFVLVAPLLAVLAPATALAGEVPVSDTTGLLAAIQGATPGDTIVLADGTIVDCDAQRDPDLFEASRIGLGAVGIITELTLQCVPARSQSSSWPSISAVPSAPSVPAITSGTSSDNFGSFLNTIPTSECSARSKALNSSAFDLRIA